MNLIERLHSKALIKPPSFVLGGTQYLTITGSFAYGVSSETSDMDVYGFCIPPKDIVFPHLAGEIMGFGQQKQRFDQFQQHHILDKEARKEYDLSIYNIIKYFQLVMENNPNMIDSLFTRDNCVLQQTKLAQHIRDNRKVFLHRGCWFKFKGYAYSQMHKMKIKNPDETSVSYESVQKHGFDVKFAYHVVRLLNEVEMILVEHDLDLMRNNEQLKAIRRGDWTMEQIEQYFHDKEKSLEEIYSKSTLRDRPDEDQIKKLLLETLEEYYGSLEDAIGLEGNYKNILRQIQKLVEKV